MPSGSQGGPTPCLYGPAPAPANHSPTQAASEAYWMTVTSGLGSAPSSHSADLQSALANRLRARLEGRGSPLYVLIWRSWGMESGVPICALRASGHRTSDNGCIGWPTPRSCHNGHSTGSAERAKKSKARLEDTVMAVGWPSPTSRDHKDGASRGTVQENLGREVWKLQGWASPTAAELGNTIEQYRAMKANMRSGVRTAITHLSHQVQTLTPTDYINHLQSLVSVPLMSGRRLSTWLSLIGPSAQLNPDFSRWLQGYPAGWGCFEGMGTR